MARADKDAVLGGMAVFAKALSSPKRLALLQLLAQCERTVDELARAASMSMANTSQHLQVLKRAGLVASSREGTSLRYRLSHTAVAEFLLSLRGMAEASIVELRGSAHSDLEAVDGAALLARVQRGEVTVLDVRPVVEYDAAHLPHAVSIPVAELAARLSELPKDRAVVAYCRGPYCEMAPDAVALLRQVGFDASVLRDGVVEWRARGFPLSQGDGR